jgi:tRNA-specific 2-thiouridylase
MDVKKKISDTYNSDKTSLKEKVVLGLTTSIDSLASAYLLKVQKYDLIAVTVLTGWEAQSLNSEKTFSCSFSQEKLDFLKSFCQRLNIPHIVEKVSNEFKDSVIDPWVGERIVGKMSHACWNCHQLRMSALHQKMIEFDASFLATGHYAKVFKHDHHGTVFVHSSNDTEFDQSEKLSRVSPEILKHLLLPLSDLTRKEVLKLADNFAISNDLLKASAQSCFSTDAGVEEFIKREVPGRFLKEGEVVTLDESSSFGQHGGMFQHTLGEIYPIKETSQLPTQYVHSYSSIDKRIRLVDESYFLRSLHMLVNCQVAQEVFLPEPTKGFLRTESGEWLECNICLKTLSSASLEFEKEVKLRPTERVAVFKKSGKNSKVLLTGDVQILPLPMPVVAQEGEKNVSKIDPLLDF